VRAEKLKEGLTGMLGTAYAGKVLGHPLTKNDLGSTGKGKDPSYLSPRNFSLALTQLLKGEGEGDVLPRLQAKVAALKEETGAGADDAKALAKQLDALLDEASLLDGPKKQLEGFMKATETWFNDTMDRVSGWYKRWSQLVNIIVALVVAIGLNASAVRIVERLESDKTVRSALVAGAQSTAEKKGSSATKAGQAAEDAVKELKSLNVPFLWSEDNLPNKSLAVFLESLAGWLITAIAISLGAPFWFDALSKLARLKTTGAKPKEEPATAT
jgi:hypothetical protein